jgi:DNA repair ATPase RecN
MRLRFFSLIPFVLCNLLAPDSGGAGGGNDAPKPAEPTGDTPEAKYTSALTIIGDYFKQLSGAMKERDESVGQVAGLKTQITDLTARATKAEGQVSTLTTEVSGLKDQVTGANDRATKSGERVTLIESFAKHHGLDLAGLDKFEAVKDVPEGDAKDGKALYQQWQDLKKNPKNAGKATAFFRKHKEEIKEYSDSLGE